MAAPAGTNKSVVRGGGVGRDADRIGGGVCVPDALLSRAEESGHVCRVVTAADGGDERQLLKVREEATLGGQEVGATG